MTFVKTKAKYPGNLADEYLALKAEQAALAEKEKALKEALIAMNKAGVIGDAVEGNYGRVSLSFIKPGVGYDYAKAAKENLSETVLSKYTKMISGTVRFNVRAVIADASVAA